MKSTIFFISVVLPIWTLAQDMHIEWSYEGETGPSHWSEISEEFSECGCGKAQSPIDVMHESLEYLSVNLRFEYGLAEIDCFNNGHTLKEIIHDENLLAVDEETYWLQQFHFHTPSEHKIDHRNYPMEIHFVHSNENGEFLVVAIFVEESNIINPSLAILEHFIPREVDSEIVEHSRMDLNLILPSTENFIHYEGSLTTPPCSEGVKWILLEETIQAAEWQLEMIHEIIKDDNRLIQKTGDRHVYLSTGTGF